MKQSKQQLMTIRDSVALVGRLSDNLIKVGPFSIGLDGLIAWIPGLGEIYSTLAGAFIVFQGVRAGVPATVLVGAVALLGMRTVATAVPIAGAAFADLFTAHKWAATMIVRAIDQKLGLTEASGHSPEFGHWRSASA